MRLRYMTESRTFWDVKLKPEAGYNFIPIGVWVQGPGPGLDIHWQFLPGETEAEERAEGMMRNLKSAGMLGLPAGFMERLQDSLNIYKGQRSYIWEVSTFDSPAACIRAIMRLIKSGKLLQATNWPGKRSPRELDAIEKEWLRSKYGL